MTITIYSASVPVFKQMLSSMSNVLTKAESHAHEHKIEPAVLLQSRLFPDMFPLVRQVQIACDFAKGVSARLANVDAPEYEDKEESFSDLQQRIQKTLDFISGLTPAQFEGSETREIITRPGTPKERKFTGHSHLFTYGLPQFFFHATTTYAILRHNGVPVGKGDFMGV